MNAPTIKLPPHVLQSLRRARNHALRKKRLKAARAAGSHTDLEWDELVKEMGNRCVICWKPHGYLEKDHILPIYQGGTDAIGNIQPACLPCNRSKGRDSFDWKAKRRDEAKTL